VIFPNEPWCFTPGPVSRCPSGAAVGGVAEFAIGVNAGGVVCLIVAAGAGWYDYRLWRRPRPIEY
jgi:hypothetical protein